MCRRWSTRKGAPISLLSPVWIQSIPGDRRPTTDDGWLWSATTQRTISTVFLQVLIFGYFLLNRLNRDCHSIHISYSSLEIYTPHILIKSKEPHCSDSVSIRKSIYVYWIYCCYLFVFTLRSIVFCCFVCSQLEAILDVLHSGYQE